jgi:hypothetical protein
MSKKDDKQDMESQNAEGTIDLTAIDEGADALSLEQLKKNVTEGDNAPTSTLTLRKILGGEILSAQMVRRQVWLCLLIALFLTFYVAFRYQCQQDMIDIAQLENELTDAKYKALSSSSTLTERCRESQVLEGLRTNRDSTLHTSSQPPYKIYVHEQ